MSGGGYAGGGASVGPFLSLVLLPPSSVLTLSLSNATQQYDSVLGQTPSFNSTIYVGNLVPYTTQADLIPLFQGFGYIVEIRMQADRGFAFVKLDTHENAANAIINLTGTPVHGRQLKCSWGKDRMDGPVGGAAGGAQGQVPQQQYMVSCS
jgi:nucleolysin TIA-1/TIAR